jgi:2-polyprenyl-6-methoxyphenol hydroxylase-like FAD-dependent oxidoreductase
MKYYTPPASSHALVIGGSIAGLLASRILSDHFAKVTVVERDDLPNTPTPRRAVPQEYHVHLLLQRGKRIIEDLFPGLMAELEAQGALVADLSHDVKCFQAGRWKGRWKTGITAHYCTRTLLEYVLRRRVRAIPSVQLFDRSEAQPVFLGPEVIGAKIIAIGGSDRFERTDLVVDASGRGSKSAHWLKDAGLTDVPTEEIITKLGYVSAPFLPSTGTPRDWKVLLCLPRLPQDKRMAVISPVEGGRWMVTAGAWFDQQPEPDHRGLLNYLRALPVPDLFEAVQSASPLDQPRRFRMLGGLRRRYDLVSRWPSGYLVIGDAVCSINPIYSQGMSVSALQAEAMGKAIALHGDDLGAVQRAICAAVETPWQQAAAVEHRFDGIGPAPGLAERLKRRYFDRLAELSHTDPFVAMTMLKVNNLIAPADSLTCPDMVLRAIGLRRETNFRKATHAQST